MASDLPERLFPTALRPLSQSWPAPRTAKAARWGSQDRHRPERRRVAPVPATALRPSCLPAGLLSSAATRDSLPGHTELIGLQVCSLSETNASHMTAAGPPPAAAPSPPAALRGTTGPGVCGRPGRAQPQLRGASRCDSVRPGTRRFRRPLEKWEWARCQQPGLQVHLLGLLRGLQQSAGR